MPHDPGQEHISAEEQFRRLMGTSEEDLPPVPEPAPEMLRQVAAPDQPSSPEGQMVQSGEVPETGTSESSDTMTKISATLDEILAELRSLQDILEDLVGGG